VQAFIKDQNLAMAINTARTSEFERAYETGFTNWDVVTIPVFKDKPGITNQSEGHYYVIPPEGKHRDAAFRVLAAVISDPEVSYSVLRDVDAKSYFEKENRLIKVKTQVLSSKINRHNLQIEQTMTI
jgi:hypothetical protein